MQVQSDSMEIALKAMMAPAGCSSEDQAVAEVLAVQAADLEEAHQHVRLSLI